MPTRNVNLTTELDKAVAERVESGRYENASEVFRAGLRALEREEREDEVKLEGLRRALEQGLRSGVAEPGVFDRVNAELDLRTAAGKALQELRREKDRYGG